MTSLFAPSHPLAFAITTAALLLWFHGRAKDLPRGKRRFLQCTALIAALNGAATWIVLLGPGPGIVGALWSATLIAPLIVLSHKILPRAATAWPWLCILAGGLHVVTS
ncbi:hypothetical protein [Acanthopleuribacter pedis]|uniref:Uncharacterized protein n=1 Tax=Acanthopleuribacter pedis TaxID=442870 RepID=A0A8J7U2A5_9BACT|nr:hypothetical protein [Acanthopleuribacter pedis]MBO1317504.1 hypothetical protein [Acanthopleuribacter pedis]